MSRAVMQQALEALEFYSDLHGKKPDAKIIRALRAALAEPEQEPVAWMQEMPVSGNEERSVRMTTVKMVADEWDNPIPLYTAPTPRRPLTDGEICAALGIDDLDDWTCTVARAIEAAHGITGEQT